MDPENVFTSPRFLNLGNGPREGKAAKNYHRNYHNYNLLKPFSFHDKTNTSLQKARVHHLRWCLSHKRITFYHTLSLVSSATADLSWKSYSVLLEANNTFFCVEISK